MLVEHDLELVMRVSDHVVVLDRGCVLAYATGVIVVPCWDRSAGKATALKAIAGLLSVIKGEIVVLGRAGPSAPRGAGASAGGALASQERRPGRGAVCSS